jgi:hypothetical protein
MSHAKWTKRYSAHGKKFSTTIFISEQINDTFISTFAWQDTSSTIRPATFVGKTVDQVLQEASDFLRNQFDPEIVVTEQQ